MKIDHVELQTLDFNQVYRLEIDRVEPRLKTMRSCPHDLLSTSEAAFPL
jgi:hypothetical protein